MACNAEILVHHSWSHAYCMVTSPIKMKGMKQFGYTRLGPSHCRAMYACKERSALKVPLTRKIFILVNEAVP